MDTHVRRRRTGGGSWSSCGSAAEREGGSQLGSRYQGEASMRLT